MGRREVTPSKVSGEVEAGYTGTCCGSPGFIPEKCHVDLASTPTKSEDRSTSMVDDFQLKVSGMVKELFVLKDT